MKLQAQGERDEANKLEDLSRLLENVVLDLLVVSAVHEHLLQTVHTTHATADAGANVGRVHVLVQLVRVGDAGHVEGLGSTDERPERSTVDLRDDVVRDAVPPGVPTGGDLPGN
jgi:hypothetical protein